MSVTHRFAATERFHRCRRHADIEALLAKFTGHRLRLVSLQEVTAHLHTRRQAVAGIRTVALDQIVGSVGRAHDFTRTFRPRASVDAERWVRLDEILQTTAIFPPVELLQIGQVYFVHDGNHRLSVARANGIGYIEAHVTALETTVPLTVHDFVKDSWRANATATDGKEQFLQPDRADSAIAIPPLAAAIGRR